MKALGLEPKTLFYYSILYMATKIFKKKLKRFGSCSTAIIYVILLSVGIYLIRPHFPPELAKALCAI